VEKIVAEILTDIAEKHNLILWNQMGARKRRSTLSAIELLIGCIQIAWKTKKFKVVTLLSLDLAGAFDNVSHTRLLHILFKKNVPRWIIRYVENFLKDRRTKIVFPGHTSD